MKRLSIKLRVTLWYTLLLIVIVALVIGFMLVISQSVIESNAQGRLKTIVDYNMEEVEYDDGLLEADEDDFDFFKDGVYSVIYRGDLTHFSGDLPSTFDAMPPFEDGMARQIVSGGRRWLVYDRQVTFKKHDPVWVRGILSLDDASSLVRSVLTIALITLPLLVMLAAAGGYWITQRAFRPVREINRTVESIQEGKDLSRRIDLGYGHDEIHEMADTYNRMLARLEASFEAEKQFVSDVSHELRTPVSVILAQCEDAMGAGGGAGQEAIGVIRRQADRMSRLIGHLLTITRLEQGAARAELEDADLSDLVEALCEERRAAGPSGITLHTDIEAGIEARIDIALMVRLIDNLLQNAFKYGNENGNVYVSLHQKDGILTLTVSDDGIGIPLEEQEKIWRRFYQVNPSRTSREAGSMGLGLAIVKQIASLHHGQVRVQSTQGEGASFIFSFPAR